MRISGTRPNATGRASGKIYGRLGKLQKPPPGEPWCWLTRELLVSDAWRSQSINGRRFIDFLLIEHMNHAGTENGRLLATYRQLEAFGVSVNHIAKAINESEGLGLVDCHRGGIRAATTYRLTWLPTADGTPPTNRWKEHKIQESAPRTEGGLPPKQRAEAPNLPPEQRADLTPQIEGPSIFRRLRASDDRRSYPELAVTQAASAVRQPPAGTPAALLPRDQPEDAAQFRAEEESLQNLGPGEQKKNRGIG